eukprot:SAG11_NODE_156_length_14147_cov_10.367597_12_plen_57_part_00
MIIPRVTAIEESVYTRSGFINTSTININRARGPARPDAHGLQPRVLIIILESNIKS